MFLSFITAGALLTAAAPAQKSPQKEDKQDYLYEKVAVLVKEVDIEDAVDAEDISDAEFEKFV